MIKRSLLHLASFVFFLIAIALIILLILSKSEQVQFWWQTYQDYLYAAQHRVETLENKGYLVFTLMFLFSFKAFIPIYPISIVCAISGVVFPVYIAIPLNLIGMGLNYTLKYIWGKKIGPGGVSIILNKNDAIRVFMEKDGKGNPWLLPLFRLIPLFPLNPVSQLYGSMGFKYWTYLLLSLIGYVPRLCVYTIVGQNAYNPLSAGFLLPLIIMSTLAAIATYLASVFLYYSKKRRKKHDRTSKHKKQAQTKRT